jgi:hypothetical protein
MTLPEPQRAAGILPADETQTSLNHSLVAEIIRRCNSPIGCSPLALALELSLALDWIKGRTRARARGGFGSALVFREE